MQDFTVLIFYGAQSGAPDLSPADGAAMTALGRAIETYLATSHEELAFAVTGIQQPALAATARVQAELEYRIQTEQRPCLDDLSSSCYELSASQHQSLLSECQEAYGRVTPRSMAGLFQTQPAAVRQCIQEYFRRGATEITSILAQLAHVAGVFPDKKIAGLWLANRFSFVEGMFRYLSGIRGDDLLHNLAIDLLREDEGHQAIFRQKDGGPVLDRIERIVLPTLTT